MSADNGISISKLDFTVCVYDFGSEDSKFLGQGRNLEDAVRIAEEYMSNWEVEYGITFIE